MEGHRGPTLIAPGSLVIAEPRAVGGVGTLLAALLVATIPLPPIARFTIDGGNLSVTWTMVLVALGLVNWAVTRMMFGPAPKSPVYRSAVAALMLMIPPAIYSNAGGASYLTYVNFAVGVCAGLLVGRAWAAQDLGRTSVIDVGMYVFLLGTAAELLLVLQEAPSLEQFHQFAETNWGRSNYVAGILVTFGVLIVVRSRLMRRGRFFPLAVATAGTAAALLTLSRGGALAAAVGLAAILWVLPRGPIAKFFGRLFALSLPLIAWYAMDVIAAQRYVVTTQADANIDARFVLYDAAWKTFIESPLIGSGWAAFRETSAALTGEQTFAHNLFLSYLQIGGLLFGVTTLFVLVVTAVKAMRRWPRIVPAVLAVAAISMTDPFTESTLGGLVTWATLSFAFLVHADQTRTTRHDYRIHSDQMRSRPLR